MMMMMMMMMMMLLNNPGLNFIESGVALWAVTRYIILVKEQNLTGRSDVEAQVSPKKTISVLFNIVLSPTMAYTVMKTASLARQPATTDLHQP